MYVCLSSRTGLTASRQEFLQFADDDKYQDHDSYDTRAEHRSLQPCLLSRNFLDDFIRDGYGVSLGAIERIMNFALDVLRMPLLDPDSVALLADMDRVMQPDGVALVLRDVGCIGFYLFNGHNFCRSTAAKEDQQHDERDGDHHSLALQSKYCSWFHMFGNIIY